MQRDFDSLTARSLASEQDQPRQWLRVLVALSYLLPPLLVLLLGSPRPATSAERPNLSGVWEMDVELSEDPQQKIEQARESRRSSRGGEIGGGRGGGWAVAWGEEAAEVGGWATCKEGWRRCEHGWRP